MFCLSKGVADLARQAKGFVTDTIRVFFLAPKRLWGRDHWRQIQQLQYGKHICIGWQRLQLATSLPSNHRSDTAIPCVGPFPHKPMVSVGAIHTRRYFLCACQMFSIIPLRSHTCIAKRQNLQLSEPWKLIATRHPFRLAAETTRYTEMESPACLPILQWRSNTSSLKARVQSVVAFVVVAVCFACQKVSQILLVRPKVS